MRVYVLNIFGILAGRCGSVVVRERYWDTKSPSATLSCDVLFSLIETLSMVVTVYEREIPGGANSFSSAVQVNYLPKLNVEVREIRGL